MEEEDQERKRKVEAGKAKLAQFRQRKGQTDSQNVTKKTKKKKSSRGSKQQEPPVDALKSNLSPCDEPQPHSAASGGSTTEKFTILRTLPLGENIKHDQTYTIEPESEISTTADDYSSEVIADHFLLKVNTTADLNREEEFGVQEMYSEHGTQSSLTRLQVMQDELAAKQQEIEELSRELEEMRAAYSTEGLEQLQEFQTAIKERDDIITQLTTNLQEARDDKDEIMEEFLELTEQSQKLKIQFQELQASETLRSTSHTNAATDLLHSKQQIFSFQQQLETLENQLKHFQNENKDYQTQIASLQEKNQNLEEVYQSKFEFSYKLKLREKELALDGLKAALIDEENTSSELKERLFVTDRSLEELKQQLLLKNQEITVLSEELKHSKQKERQSSSEIKQLMGTVEDLQKKHHKGTQFNTDIVQRMEAETQKKLEQLQAELDEIHGQQIIQMKQELMKQHSFEIEKLVSEHKKELMNVSNETTKSIANKQINVLTSTIDELNGQLQKSDDERKKMKEDFSQQLQIAASEKSQLQRQIEDLLEDLSCAREQIQRDKQNITEKESKLIEASQLHATIEEFQTQLAMAAEFTKELEVKHDAEITNYKIKLDMLEREKDAVLDRMAEFQEAELEKLRTSFLFSQEEELSKLREDLTREHRTNIENLKDNLEVQHKAQIDRVQHEMNQTINAMQSDKDNLITKQNHLMLEISKLKNLLQSTNDSKAEEMMIHINELQKEVDSLRREEKEKGTIEQETQKLQLRIEMLENEVKAKDLLNERIANLETDNRLLKDQNNILQNKLKNQSNIDYGKNMAAVMSENPDLKNEVEKLTVENIQLRNQEHHLKEEIERQKNTFSFAEKNFEVNYHELQEEYASLLKLKEQIEENKAKQEEEYKIKLNNLYEQLAKVKRDSADENIALKDLRHDALSVAKHVTAELLEGGEVVEKDTTELMGRLEIAQHDKPELPLTLSDLSAQLQLKENEIKLLKDKIKSLYQERDKAFSAQQNLGEICVKKTSSIQTVREYSTEREVVASNDDLPISAANEDLSNEREEHSEQINPISRPPSHLVSKTWDLQQENTDVWEERETLLQRLQELTSELERKSLLLLNTQKEKDELLQNLHQEQADLRLQLEAQRISLTQIHAAHLKITKENFQTEKEKNLSNLKDETLKAQEQRMQEPHQQEPQEITLKLTDDETESCKTLTELLMKTIRNQYDQINQCLTRILAKVPGGQAEIEHNLVASHDSSCVKALQHHIKESQTIHTNLSTLLDTFMKEHKRMSALHSSLDKVEVLQTTKEEIDITNLKHILFISQEPKASDIPEPLIIMASQSEEAEKLKIEFSQQRTQLEEKHSKEIEHLRFYFQQQLKENKERYTTEIIHLQRELQNVRETSSLQFRELSERHSEVNLGLQETGIFKNVCEPVTDVSKVDDGILLEDKPVHKSGDLIYQQLQTLRQDLCAKYVEEVDALKKQHEAELLQLTVDLKEKYSCENAALKQELTKAKQTNVNGSYDEQPSFPLCNIKDKKHQDMNELLEKRYRERIEEEIARVIVELTVTFAQKTELTRLAALKNGEAGSPHGNGEFLDMKKAAADGRDGDADGRDECALEQESKQEFESVALTSGVDMQKTLPCEASDDDQISLDSVTIESHAATSLSTEKDDTLRPRHQDTNLIVESPPKEKTVVLKENDYNQIVAMGAENAKLKNLYEECVEDMRQELVRLEQESQQAMEAMRLSHMSQLERQMYDQEQLLSELHILRAQLAENASVISENRTKESEIVGIEELESVGPTGLVTREKQEKSTQTQFAQDEQVAEMERKEQECVSGHPNEDGDEESRDTPSTDSTSERYSLRKVNMQLLKILLEIVKTTSAVEETIGRHVIGLLDKPGTCPSTSKVIVWSPEPEGEEEGNALEISSIALSTAGGDYVELKDASIWSGATDESLDPPLQLTDIEFAGLNLNPLAEAQVFNISTRLQAAVEKLLEAINETSNQLEHAKAAQTELVRESIKRKRETTDLLRCQEELQERLNEEARAREHLALELSKAEGLLDGYSDERVFLEKQIKEKTDLIEHLERELQITGNRLQEFEQERQQIEEERELLSRQKNALKADAAPAEQRLVDAAVDAAPKEELLEETEKLLKEKIEVQRQAEKDSGDLQKHVKLLESELEEQLSRYLELEQEKNADLEDLRQKNLALEKQLEKTRKFLDEQAVDREHERDVFQQEIQKLEEQLKMPQRHQPASNHQNKEVEKLANNLKEKTDKCSELLLCKEQLQRDVQERNDEIEKLESRIRELEQALLVSADSLQKVEDKKQAIVLEIKGEMPLEAQLQVEREAIDRKEKEITNLEEQLEQFREELENKNEEVQQLHMQLEIQRKESATQLHELEQEIKALKDDLDHLQQEDQDGISVKDRCSKPAKFEEILRGKDQQIDHLNECIEKLQAQLDAATDNKEIEEKDELIKEYKSQIKCLKSDQESLKKNSEEEREKLNEVIEKLQQELGNIEQKVSVDFASMTEESDKQHFDEMMKNELLNIKASISDMAFVKATFDKAIEDVMQMKEEIVKLNKAGDHPAKAIENIGDEEMVSVLETKNSDERLEEPSVQGSSSQVPSSVLDIMQNTIQTMEAEIQQLQDTIKERNLELLQYSDQIKLLKEQSQEIEQLNKVIEKLQQQLAERYQDFDIDNVENTEGAESSKHQLEALIGEKMLLAQKSELSSLELSLARSELETANSELELLRKELEELRRTPEKATLEKMKSKKEERIHVNKNGEKLKEELREKTAQLLASQTLLASVQETMQSSVCDIESQLKEHRRAIEKKDLEVHQCTAEIEFLKKQIQEQDEKNEVIKSLQQELTGMKEKLSVAIANGENLPERGKHHLGAGIGEKLQQKTDLNDVERHQAMAELEDTKMELKILKEELEKINVSKENSKVCEHNLSGDGTICADKRANIQNIEAALTEKTAQLLECETMLASVQEAMQSRLQNMESQLQECQTVIKEKDKELLHSSTQIKLLKERTQEVEQLNSIIETLKQSLANVEQKVSGECSSKTENVGILELTGDKVLQQKNKFNWEDENLAKTELNRAKEEIKVLKRELEILRTSQEYLKADSHQSKAYDLSQDMESAEGKKVKEEAVLREKTVQCFPDQAQVTSVQETIQNTVQNLESQLQELQKLMKEKDLELMHYSNEVELLKQQVQTENDEHTQILSTMEDTLREKVAAALVSEVQMKAIQVHSKIMQKTCTASILEDESRGTQTNLSKHGEDEEAETKLSELSLRLLQLEKQLSDLHEELQVEREQVSMAKQQAAEKEVQLRELQNALEGTKQRRDENCIENQSQMGVNATSQKLSGLSPSKDELESELQRLKAEAIITKEDLCHSIEMVEKLRDQLMIKETSVSRLEEDLHHVKQCLIMAEDKLASCKKIEEQTILQRSAVDVLDSVEVLQQTPFDRQTSSSQTDKAMSVNNSNQTPYVHLKDVGVQNDFESATVTNTSDEVTEIIEQFTEKIGQMQDLHAAEILDMEARHISESEYMRSEHYVAVQALTEQCKALNAVIDALQPPTGAFIPQTELSTSVQFTDATSSEASSDLSRGTYLVQCVDSVPEGVRSEEEASVELIPSKIKNLLRAVHQEGIQVLTLTEPASPEKDGQSRSFAPIQNPWLKERERFLETIASLKNLIRKMQVREETTTIEGADFCDGVPDWRGELLSAIQEVFCREQDILLAAFHTQLATLGSDDAVALVNQMQHTLQEQGIEQINAMDCIQNADRRSMLLELKELRAQLIGLQDEASRSPSFHSKAEDVLGYRLHLDQPPQTQDINLPLSNAKVKSEKHLNSESSLVEEMNKELAQTKMELESTLKMQHKHFKELESLRMEVRQRTNELDGVNEMLANEQKKTRELQWTLEKEKAKIERNEERGKEELEDLKMLVEDQRLKYLQISNLLEREKQMVKELQERIASRETVFDTVLSQEKSKVSALQAFLDAEKIRTSELVNALECKRQLEAQMQNIDGSVQTGGHNPAEILQELQSQLNSKHNSIIELMSENESCKLECVQLRQTIAKERQRNQEELQAEQEAGKATPQQTHVLKSMVEELKHKLKERTLEVQKLQADEKYMKEEIYKLQNKVQANPHKDGTERTEPGSSAAGRKVTIDPTKELMQQQKGGEVTIEPSTASLGARNGHHATDGGPFSMEHVRMRLQQVYTKLKQLAVKANQRKVFEDADDEDFTSSLNNIQEAISQLEQLAVLTLQQNLVLPPGTSLNSLTEKLLKQNSELTGYVSRLTEEKNDMRNALLKLEEDACRHRLALPSGDQFCISSLDNEANINTLIATERELWNREKRNLQKSLKQSEAELSKLKAELRSEEKQRSLGRESENIALKRIYGKYLRSESFRKALVYQKNYLLLLLGGFQECEEATLALIARMGGQPSYTDLEVITNHSRAFTRFRSAVRVSIAISRMKFLVRRWQRPIGSSPGNMNRNGFGLITGNELRTDSPYLPAGSLELYGEQRHSSGRPRSGFDSPQSSLNSHNRYMAVPTDVSPCSHLQHYDPDRALTDYISRLEALQKRLGTVQSGSSTNTTHYGTRR